MASRIEVKAAGPKVAEIWLHGDIGSLPGYESPITSAAVAQALKKAGQVDTLRVFVNSPGGSAFDGLAIYSMLARHPARVEVLIEGVAASAAAFIAMAADNIVMAPTAFLMIHEAHTWACGFASDLRASADRLDMLNAQQIDIFTKRTGQLREKIVELLAAETWFTAEEAVAAGFADEIDHRMQAAAYAGDIDRFQYRHVPPAVAKARDAAHERRMARLARLDQHSKKEVRQ